MIEFINKLTGTRMWVADERKDEYLAAGHVLAANALKPTEAKEQIEEEIVEAAPKKPAKRTPKKK